MKNWIFILFFLPHAFSALGQSGLPPHYHCVTSGVNNGLMHPSVAFKVLFIYNQAEVAAMTAPVTGPVNISRIYFRTNNGGTANYTGLTIRMGHSSIANASTSTTFATNFNVGAPVTVYNGNASFVMSGSNSSCGTASTWFYLDLTTPFAYNFTNNLVVELSYSAHSGTIPSYYALNPGGGANPTSITSATAGAATGSINSRPMFGISASAFLGDESIQLQFKGSDRHHALLEWSASAPELAEASFHIHDEAGQSLIVPAGDPGLHEVPLSFSGELRGEILAQDVLGNALRSNSITWYQPPVITISPNPANETFRISAGEMIQQVRILNAEGKTVLEMECGANEVLLGGELAAGMYVIEITMANQQVIHEQLIKAEQN